ncbi:MAG: hypothetical protein ACXW3X_04245 [Rhodoplanes sp.]
MNDLGQRIVTRVGRGDCGERVIDLGQGSRRFVALTNEACGLTPD